MQSLAEKEEYYIISRLLSIHFTFSSPYATNPSSNEFKSTFHFQIPHIPLLNPLNSDTTHSHKHSIPTNPLPSTQYSLPLPYFPPI